MNKWGDNPIFFLGAIYTEPANQNIHLTIFIQLFKEISSKL